MVKKAKKDKKTSSSDSNRKRVAISIICVLAVFMAILTEGIYSFVFADQDILSLNSGASVSGKDTVLSKAKKIPSAPPISVASESDTNKASNDNDASSSVNLVEDKNVKPSNVLNCMEPGLASDFLTLSDDQWQQLSEIVTNLSHVMSFSLPDNMTSSKIALLHAVLTKAAIDNEFFTGDALIVAKTYMNDALERLKIQEKEKYSQRKYNALSRASLKFALNYNSAKSAKPNQVIFYGQSFILNYPLINYNDTLMIAMNDIYQFIDTTSCYIDSDSLTVSIVSDDVRAEYVPGKNETYINDKSAVMDVPLLCINETYYMPINFFAQYYSVKYATFTDNGSTTILIYDNLNQLETKSIPNQLIFEKTIPTSSEKPQANSSKDENSNETSS